MLINQQNEAQQLRPRPQSLLSRIGEGMSGLMQGLKRPRESSVEAKPGLGLGIDLIYDYTDSRPEQIKPNILDSNDINRAKFCSSDKKIDNDGFHNSRSGNSNNIYSNSNTRNNNISNSDVSNKNTRRRDQEDGYHSGGDEELESECQKFKPQAPAESKQSDLIELSSSDDDFEVVSTMKRRDSDVGGKKKTCAKEEESSSHRNIRAISFTFSIPEGVEITENETEIETQFQEDTDKFNESLKVEESSMIPEIDAGWEHDESDKKCPNSSSSSSNSSNSSNRKGQPITCKMNSMNKELSGDVVEIEEVDTEADVDSGDDDCIVVKGSADNDAVDSCKSNEKRGKNSGCSDEDREGNWKKSNENAFDDPRNYERISHDDNHIEGWNDGGNFYYNKKNDNSNNNSNNNSTNNSNSKNSNNNNNNHSNSKKISNSNNNNDNNNNNNNNNSRNSYIPNALNESSGSSSSSRNTYVCSLQFYNNSSSSSIMRNTAGRVGEDFKQVDNGNKRGTELSSRKASFSYVSSKNNRKTKNNAESSDDEYVEGAEEEEEDEFDDEVDNQNSNNTTNNNNNNNNNHFNNNKNDEDDFIDDSEEKKIRKKSSKRVGRGKVKKKDKKEIVGIVTEAPIDLT